MERRAIDGAVSEVERRAGATGSCGGVKECGPSARSRRTFGVVVVTDRDSAPADRRPVLVRLLGPVDAVVDGAERAVSGLRRTAVLATLALQPGEVVGAHQLIKVVWEGEAPATVANTLQSHVSHLRRLLGGKEVILARPPGYVLSLGTEPTDIAVGERLIREGTSSSDPTERVARLERAVALWRGRPLTNLAELPWFDGQSDRLEQWLLSARQALIDAKLAMGQHVQLIGELETLVHRYPLREPFHEQLMRALYGAGRQADALSAYRRLRRTLDDRLGIGPALALQDLEMAILRQDPALHPVPPVRVEMTRTDRTRTVPMQLPAAVTTFVGRATQLDRLDRLLDDAGEGPAIVSIVGTAGVGKTALAVHWAHRLTTRFPDGQLYVDLRGFAPTGPALTPSEALKALLEAFGVAEGCIPGALEARVNLYRSLSAGRRLLVVLDNARDVEQIRPLLPGSPGSLVVVSSRDRLTALVMLEGAHPLTLEVPSSEDAYDLIARRLGVARTAADPAAVRDIVVSCARLPLALAIVAARATTCPGRSLERLAAELRDPAQVLDAMDGGDPAADLRTAFASSYRALGPDAAALLRILSLAPMQDISRSSAAHLAGLPPERAARSLAELTRTHLLTEPANGWYRLHRLLRIYAAELCRAEDSDQVRHEAARRLADRRTLMAHPVRLDAG